MSSITSNLSLSLMVSQGAENTTRLNEDLAALDVLVMPRVKSRAVTSPPSAAAGDAYAVPTGSSGAWAAKAGQIAFWNGSNWRYVPAETGFQAYCEAEKCVVTKSGSAWITQSECAELALKTTSDSSAITGDAAISWPTSLLDVANSVTATFDSGNPTRVTVTETGDYCVSAQVTFSASGTSSWNSMRARLQTSPDGTTWTDVADAAAYVPVRPTDVPQCTAHLDVVVNITGPKYLRLVVNRVSGSSTVVATANTRMRLRKVR
mgnify:CR=1 FL=1